MRTQRANHMSNNATNGYIKILQHLNSRNWDGTLTYVIRVLIPFLVAGSLLCGAEAFECPAAVAVHEGLAKAIPGWTTMLDDSAHQLAAVTFYDGPPEEKASLVYDRIVKAAGGGEHFIVKWLRLAYLILIPLTLGSALIGVGSFGWVATSEWRGLASLPPARAICRAM